MNNLAVGVELLLSGMLIVFLVLVFLMYLMKAIYAVVGDKPTAEEKHPVAPPLSTEITADVSAEELVAIMSVLGKVLPADQQAVVKVTPTAAEEEERLVAAIAGALAAR